MDRLDIKILGELSRDPTTSPLHSDIRKSFRTVAGELELSESTVRDRVAKLQQSGFLRGWALMVNPRLLGLNMRVVWLDVDSHSSKKQLIRKLRLIHGAATIISYYGSLLLLVLFYESERTLRKELELITRISESENLFHSDLWHPPCEIALSPTDLKIIENLQSEPHKSNTAVANYLGLSSKTVKRRLDRMIKAKALFTILSLNPSKLEGSLLADLLVSYENTDSRIEVDKRIQSYLDEYLIVPETALLDYGAFHSAITNISKAQEILDWTKEQPGIRGARIDIVQDRIELYESFKEILQEKLAQTTLAVRQLSK